MVEGTGARARRQESLNRRGPISVGGYRRFIGRIVPVKAIGPVA